MKLLSLFSGLGAFEKALTRQNIKYELVNYCEIDKYASKAYSLIHNESEDKNLGDINNVDEESIPDFDLMTWGFPCTDISIAGKQKGIIKKETRSGLYYEGLRILQYKRPKLSIIENVKALTEKKFEKQFKQILNDLEMLGYNNTYFILNAKDYNTPHHRERVFIISSLDKLHIKEPEKLNKTIKLCNLLETEVPEKYYLSLQAKERLYNIEKRAAEKNLGYKNIMVDIYMDSKGKLYEKEEQIFLNLDANFFKGADGKRTMINIIPDQYIKDSEVAGLRMPTPLECFRLMGFDDKDYYILKEYGISDTQLYKMTGNSIVVKVLEEIFKNLLK